jgi:hypothetical protein
MLNRVVVDDDLQKSYNGRPALNIRLPPRYEKIGMLCIRGQLKPELIRAGETTLCPFMAVPGGIEYNKLSIEWDCRGFTAGNMITDVTVGLGNDQSILCRVMFRRYDDAIRYASLSLPMPYQISSTSSSFADAFALVVPLVCKVSMLKSQTQSASPGLSVK